MHGGGIGMNRWRMVECLLRCCRQSWIRKCITWALIALGAILVIIFVPMDFWLAALGVVCILIGVMLILDGR